MTYILNDPLCESLVGNTGIPSCVVDPKEIVGCILIPRATVYSAANILTLVTVLQTATTAILGARAYPIFRFEEVADNSETMTPVAYGYGGRKPGRDGKYLWSFKIINGGVMLQGNIRKFNQSNAFKVLLIHKDGMIIGTRSGTDGMTGITMDYSYGHPWKISDGSAAGAPIYMFDLALSKPEEINEDIAYVNTSGADIEALVTGVMDIELYSILEDATTVTFGVRTVIDKVSLYAAYSTLLADLDLIVVTKAGVVVTPASVAAAPASEGWLLTLTAPTGAHVITLDPVATLAAAGVGGTPETGFEVQTAGQLTVTFP